MSIKDEKILQNLSSLRNRYKFLLLTLGLILSMEQGLTAQDCTGGMVIFPHEKCSNDQTCQDKWGYLALCNLGSCSGAKNVCWYKEYSDRG